MKFDVFLNESRVFTWTGTMGDLDGVRRVAAAQEISATELMHALLEHDVPNKNQAVFLQVIALAVNGMEGNDDEEPLEETTYLEVHLTLTETRQGPWLEVSAVSR